MTTHTILHNISWTCVQKMIHNALTQTQKIKSCYFVFQSSFWLKWSFAKTKKVINWDYTAITFLVEPKSTNSSFNDIVLLSFFLHFTMRTSWPALLLYLKMTLRANLTNTVLFVPGLPLRPACVNGRGGAFRPQTFLCTCIEASLS